MQVKPLITVVMPSYLGNYPNAAKNRETKILRAIQSVQNQSLKEWELIIIADGCQKSVDLLKENGFLEDTRISLYYIDREGLWSGSPRNAGIHLAKSDYIIYLDIDDSYKTNYLEEVVNEIQDGKPWYYMDDIIYTKNGYERRKVNFNVLGKCGTSNVVHRKDCGVTWATKGTYAHDFNFIKELLKIHKNPRKLHAYGYIVHHIPNVYDV